MRLLNNRSRPHLVLLRSTARLAMEASGDPSLQAFLQRHAALLISGRPERRLRPQRRVRSRNASHD